MKLRALWAGMASVFLAVLLLTAVRGENESKSTPAPASSSRLVESVRYLASDKLEGRGIGTEGLNKAADFIAAEFNRIGLDMRVIEGEPFQQFTMTTESKLLDGSSAKFTGPDGKSIAFETPKDFTPLAIGAGGKIDAPVVFVGYGITAKDHGYDDYANVDVRGKVVFMLRHGPDQANPHSNFDKTFTAFIRKVSNAYEHGAVGVVLCNGQQFFKKKVEEAKAEHLNAVTALEAAQSRQKAAAKLPANEKAPTEANIKALQAAVEEARAKVESASDPRVKFMEAGEGDNPHIPVFFCRREAIDRVLLESGIPSLAKLESDIETGPTPHSRELDGWRFAGEAAIERLEAPVRNVIAVLEGEGELANETVVVGAHYDHLGYGGGGSLAPGSREIHNGADDNGSGTAALLEVARLLKRRGEAPKRRIVFIAFTGEERGLIGSARYCKDPAFPLESTIAMLNMDMVGRLADNKLIVHGVDTATEFGRLLEEVNKTHRFELIKQDGGYGPSDHASFYAKKIPVLHFFTGTHKDYHRPSDDFELLNLEGMSRVSKLVADVTWNLSNVEGAPTYVASKARTAMGVTGDRPDFGSVPDFAAQGEGYAISDVRKDSPADKAGLKGGDSIIHLGDSKVGNLEDFDSALRKWKAGDKVLVRVRRGDKEVEFQVKLGEPR